MVAIHGEYNTLHLAGLPLMLEMYFHSLPFQAVSYTHLDVYKRQGLSYSPLVIQYGDYFCCAHKFSFLNGCHVRNI